MTSEEAYARACIVTGCDNTVYVPATVCADCKTAYQTVADNEALDRIRKFEAARHRYLAKRYGPSWRLWLYFISDAFAASFCGRVAGGAWFLVALLLTVGGCLKMAHSVEVPNQIIAAIAEIETGTTWRGTGDVRGVWSRGNIGEVSPWQLSPAVLRDLRAYDRRSRVHSDTVFAESLVRQWLSRLHDATGSWSQAVAAYHAGIAGRHRRYARDYAARVFSVAGL